MRRLFEIGLALALAATAAPTMLAQRGGWRGIDPYQPNAHYDGRFVFVRIKYTSTLAGGGDGRFGGRGRFGWRNDPKWDHDYFRAERHFTRILRQLTTLEVRTDSSNILTLDDPELFKYPVAYLTEPGFWLPSEKELAGLRSYLKKGGFLILDDFEGEQIRNLETQLERLQPGMRMIPLTVEHPIFDSFYRIESLDFRHPYFRVQSKFLGVFEDNDPTKRLLMIVNHDNDIGDYWEFSDTGMFPIDLSNEAYKLGVNYVVYALTR